MWRIDFFHIQFDGFAFHINAKISQTDSDEGRTFESFDDAKKFLIEQLPDLNEKQKESNHYDGH